MSDIFVSVPTKHGDAKLLWSKAQSAAIIPTGAKTCTLHYDGIPISVIMSSQSLADKLSHDPLVSISHLQNGWLGQTHEGYNHLTLNYSHKGRLGDGETDSYWRHQFMQIHVFQMPFLKKGSQKLKTKLRLVALMHSYASDPFDNCGYLIKDSAKHELSRDAIASFDCEIILKSNAKINLPMLHKHVGISMLNKAIEKRPAKVGQYFDMENQMRLWFAHGHESIIQSPQFPGEDSLVTDAEYTARLNSHDSTMRSSFEYQLADLHAQSRISAANAIAMAIRCAGSSISIAIEEGARMQAMATVCAASNVTGGLVKAARIRENIYNP